MVFVALIYIMSIQIHRLGYFYTFSHLNFPVFTTLNVRKTMLKLHKQENNILTKKQLMFITQILLLLKMKAFLYPLKYTTYCLK